jgi:hypothetical protein
VLIITFYSGQEKGNGTLIKQLEQLRIALEQAQKEILLQSEGLAQNKMERKLAHNKVCCFFGQTSNDNLFLLL